MNLLLVLFGLAVLVADLMVKGPILLGALALVAVLGVALWRRLTVRGARAATARCAGTRPSA